MQTASDRQGGVIASFSPLEIPLDHGLLIRWLPDMLPVRNCGLDLLRILLSFSITAGDGIAEGAWLWMAFLS